MIRLTRKQVREVDRRSIEEFHVPGIVLMENASRGAADAALRMMCGTAAPGCGPGDDAAPLGSEQHRRGRLCRKNVLVLCGGGNNGGDGLAAARHLHNAGCDIQIALTIDPVRYQGDALINWQIIQAMQLPVAQATVELIGATKADLILDAIFGTGLTEPPRDRFANLVAALEGRSIPILAIDLPSGLDCDTGKALGSCVRATRTITFVAEKIGFANPAARQYLGDVDVAGIGCPSEIVDS
jgi:NAD(P)H-hydrate epimerase